MTKTGIRHHLSDAILMGYAAGSLPEAFNLVAATHISMCDECRARMMEFEVLGGEVLEDQAEVAVTDASLRATFALIENAAWAPSRRPSAPPARAGGLFPAPLRSYVGGDVDAVRWKRIGGGVSQAILPTASDASVRLLRIPGGSRVPDHGHRGLELTLVLQGAFYDDRARFGPGDVEVADAEFEHQPVAEEGPDCICLAASDAPLRFRSFLPRVLQSFIRI